MTTMFWRLTIFWSAPASAESGRLWELGVASSSPNLKEENRRRHGSGTSGRANWKRKFGQIITIAKPLRSALAFVFGAQWRAGTRSWLLPIRFVLTWNQPRTLTWPLRLATWD